MRVAVFWRRKLPEESREKEAELGRSEAEFGRDKGTEAVAAISDVL